MFTLLSFCYLAIATVEKGLLGPNMIDSSFDFYMAPDEVLLKDVGDFFKNVNNQTYTYSARGNGIKLSSMVEQRFGEFISGLECGEVIFMEDIKNSSTGSSFSTFGSLCNDTLVLLFNFSKDTYSISNTLLLEGKGRKCAGLNFNPDSRMIAVTCFSEDQNSINLQIFDIAGSPIASQTFRNVFKYYPAIVQTSVAVDSDVIIIYEKDMVIPKTQQLGLPILIVSRKGKGFSNVEYLKILDPTLVSMILSLDLSLGQSSMNVISLVYLDPDNNLGAQTSNLVYNGSAWTMTDSASVGGVDSRNLKDNSRILLNTTDYIEYDSSKSQISRCSVENNALVVGSCITNVRSVSLTDLLKVKSIRFSPQGPVMDFKYQDNLFTNNETISAVVLKWDSNMIDFDQITDKHSRYIMPSKDGIFVCKLGKYSYYSKTVADERTKVLISANDVKNGKEKYFIDQQPIGGGLINTVNITVYVFPKMTTEYGFLPNFPDFAGYINMMSNTSFSRDFLFGNNINLQLKSNSTQSCQVYHLQDTSYAFPDNITADSSDIFFANVTHGLVRIKTNATISSFSLCKFVCDPHVKGGQIVNYYCSVNFAESQCRNEVVQIDISSIMPISQSGLGGIIALIKVQNLATLLYFPSVDDKLVALPVGQSSLNIKDVIFYILNYDGYLAVTYTSVSFISIYRLPGMNLKIEDFFNITSGTASIPSDYFCPTKIDVCPDNPSVLDVLSDCPQDTRILKFIMETSTGSYNLYDMNTLNHPILYPNAPQLDFCAMGNEFIVSAFVNNSLIIYGRTTEHEGVQSFHTFNFEDFGFQKITQIKCLNYMRGFVVSGPAKYPKTGNGFAVIFGNMQGNINKKYSKVYFEDSDFKGVSSTSSSDLIAMYAVQSKFFHFMHLDMYGPHISIHFTDDEKYDAQLVLSIERGEYGLPNLEKKIFVNLMPFQSETIVTNNTYHTVQKANYSLDRIFTFHGHVLSASILKKGGLTTDVIINPRLSSFFSPFSSFVEENVTSSTSQVARKLQAKDQVVNKFNRLFDLGDKLVGLTNDSSSSYLFFYKDYYTQTDSKMTISDAICQNLDVANASGFYFIVLKCNNYNVFSVIWVVVSANDSVRPLIKRFTTDEIDSVSVGKQGDRGFVIATNFVTGLKLTVAMVDIVSNQYITKNEQNITLDTKGRPFSSSEQH